MFGSVQPYVVFQWSDSLSRQQEVGCCVCVWRSLISFKSGSEAPKQPPTPHPLTSESPEIQTNTWRVSGSGSKYVARCLLDRLLWHRTTDVYVIKTIFSPDWYFLTPLASQNSKTPGQKHENTRIFLKSWTVVNWIPTLNALYALVPCSLVLFLFVRGRLTFGAITVPCYFHLQAPELRLESSIYFITCFMFNTQIFRVDSTLLTESNS